MLIWMERTVQSLTSYVCQTSARTHGRIGLSDICIERPAKPELWKYPENHLISFPLEYTGLIEISKTFYMGNTWGWQYLGTVNKCDLLGVIISFDWIIIFLTWALHGVLAFKELAKPNTTCLKNCCSNLNNPRGDFFKGNLRDSLEKWMMQFIHISHIEHFMLLIAITGFRAVMLLSVCCQQIRTSVPFIVNVLSDLLWVMGSGS